MSTNVNESIREALNRADPNTLADLFRALRLGDMLRTETVALRSVAATLQPQQIATVAAVVLPEDAKAASIVRCTVKASGVTNGEFAIQLYGTTPTTRQVAVAPNGDIAFLNADAVTSADVVYIPEIGDVLGALTNTKLGVTSLTLAVVPSTGVAVLPAALQGSAILLMRAVATVATTGQGTDRIIVVPGTVPATTLQANLNLAKTQVQFEIADAVSQAVVDVLVVSGKGGGVDANGLLEAINSPYV